MKQLKIILMPIEKIIPYVNNAKIHSESQVKKLASSISEFGFDQPIVVDKNNIIIKGHGRREAAMALGLTKVPVLVADHLDEYQIKAARIADNKSSSNDYDLDLLKIDLGSLKLADYDLKLTAISEFELDGLLNELNIDDKFQANVIGEFQNTAQTEGNPIVGEVEDQGEREGLDSDEQFSPRRWSFTLTFENQEQFTFAVNNLKEYGEDLAASLLKLMNYEG